MPENIGNRKLSCSTQGGLTANYGIVGSLLYGYSTRGLKMPYTSKNMYLGPSANT